MLYAYMTCSLSAAPENDASCRAAALKTGRAGFRGALAPPASAILSPFDARSRELRVFFAARTVAQEGGSNAIPAGHFRCVTRRTSKERG